MQSYAALIHDHLGFKHIAAVKTANGFDNWLFKQIFLNKILENDLMLNNMLIILFVQFVEHPA